MTGRQWILGTACGVMSFAAATAADWPQWRGPTRDNKASDFKVPATWPKELKQKWKVEVGIGEASPVLAGDKLYAFTRVDSDEVVTCLNVETGKPVWSDKYPVTAMYSGDRQHQGPRATPVVGEGMLVTFGVTGTITCYNAETGKRAWQKKTDLFPMFHTSSSPVISDGLVVVYVGGEGGSNPGGGLTAFDLKTGDEKWKWTGELVKYGSPVIATIAGTKQVVTLSARSLVGVSFADGKLLWKSPAGTGMAYNACTPIVEGDTVYVSGQGMGTQAIKVEKDGDKFAAKDGWKKTNVMSTNFNTPLLKDGLLYAMSGAGGLGGGRGGPGGGGGRGGPPGGAGGGRGGPGGPPGEARAGNSNLVCMDAKSGEVKWTKEGTFGDCGGVFDVGSYLLALSNKSELCALKPSATGFEEVAKYKVADTGTWALPILTGNRVIVKDFNSVILWTME